jgi:hypothetical protein
MSEYIAALKAERDRLRTMAFEFEEDARLLAKERDRLDKSTGTWMNAFANMAIERDKLRAALEEINRPFDTTMTGLETANLLREIARRALEGK